MLTCVAIFLHHPGNLARGDDYFWGVRPKTVRHQYCGVVYLVLLILGLGILCCIF